MPRKQQRGKSHRSRGERRISIRSVQRTEPDLRKLGRALIAFAVAQAEAEAQNGSAPESAAAPERSRTADPSGDADD
jgi:hypothetical protein